MVLSRQFAFIASLAPVPCRDDIAIMAQRHFVSTGNAAEVGVHQGLFAEKNLKAWQHDYYAIDAWSLGSNVVDQRNLRRPNTNFSVVDHSLYATAAKRLRPFGERVHMVRSFSVDAANAFEDGFFDFVYIDTLHTYEAVVADLHAWWPKLRQGGLLAGTLKHFRWQKAQVDITRWGTVSAVLNFSRGVGAVLHVTYVNDCYEFPAWWLVKDSER